MISFVYTPLDFKNYSQYDDGVKRSTYLPASVGQGFAVVLQQDPSKSQWPPKGAALCPPAPCPGLRGHSLPGTQAEAWLTSWWAISQS